LQKEMMSKSCLHAKEIVIVLFLQMAGCVESLRVLYPEHPLYSKAADEPYQPEYSGCREKGIACSHFDFDEFLAYGKFRPRPAIQ
jgi:hypothetical protein